MSFLLPGPGKPVRRSNNNNNSSNNNNNNKSNNHGGVGVARLSMRNNSNSAVGSFIGDNTRVVPRPRNTSLLNRGNRNQSQQQQISGNQIMLQRQKRTTTTGQRQKQQHQQQQQQQQQPAKQQEQENLSGTSMEEIMKDIAILEQQQKDAQRKLANAQTTKQNKLNQQRQFNALLEKKKYSNGALRAKLQQCRDFLSFATRDLGSCDLGRDRFAGEIGEFGKKLNKGIRSARMIKNCNGKIDSLINLTEHKVFKISRLKREKNDKTKEALMKYEETEKEDRMLRSTIQEAYKKAREWAEEKASLRVEISKLDSDKMAAQNTEQSTELRVQSALDQTKFEEDRAGQLKAAQLREIEETVKQKVNIQLEINSMSNSIQILKLDLQAQKEEIMEFKNAEQGNPVSSNVSIGDGDIVPVFDQTLFRADLTKIEADAKKEDIELNALNRSIEETERALQKSKEENLKNKEEATMLDSSSKSMGEEEEKRREDAEKFKTTLKITRVDVSKLKDSFHEMEETREAEAQNHCKAITECGAEISKHVELVEDLKLKIRSEDTFLKTKIRLSEEQEKPKLLVTLKEAEKRCRCAEENHQGLVDKSTDASIEAKLQSKFEFEVNYNDEKAKRETQIRNLIAKRDGILEEFPELQNINFIFDKNEDRKKQIDLALVDLKRGCNDRLAAVQATKERKIREKEERRLKSEAATAKLKRKEETKSKLKRSQLREEASGRAGDLEGGCLVEDSVPGPRGDDIDRRQRHRNGSNFFDPRGDDKMDDNVVETPTYPRKLASSFSQSQNSSDKRVRWGDDIDEDNHTRAEEEEYIESHFKDDDETEISESRFGKAKPVKTAKVAQQSKSILRDVNVNVNSNKEYSRSSKYQVDSPFEAEEKQSSSDEEEETDLQKKTENSEFSFGDNDANETKSYRRQRYSISNDRKQDKVGELHKERTRSSRITREGRSLDYVSSAKDNDDSKNNHKRSRSSSSSSRDEDEDENRERRVKQAKKSENSTRDGSSLYAGAKDVKNESSSNSNSRMAVTGSRGRYQKNSSSSLQRQKSRSSKSIDKDPRKERREISTDDRHESILVKASSSKISSKVSSKDRVISSKDRGEKNRSRRSSSSSSSSSRGPEQDSREKRRDSDDASIKSVSSKGKGEKKRSHISSRRNSTRGTDKDSREKRRDSDDASLKSVSSRGRVEKKRSHSSSSSRGADKDSREKRRDSDDASIKNASSRGRVEKKRSHSSSSSRGADKDSREKRRDSDDASIKSVSSRGRVEKKRNHSSSSRGVGKDSREKRRDSDDASIKSVTSRGRVIKKRSQSSSSSSRAAEKRDDASLKSVASKGKTERSKSRSTSSRGAEKEIREKRHDGSVRDDISLKSISSKGKTGRSKSRSSGGKIEKETRGKRHDSDGRDDVSLKSASSKNKVGELSKSYSSSNSSKSIDKESREMRRSNSRNSVSDATFVKENNNRTKNDKSAGVRKESRGKEREKVSSDGARKRSSVRGDSTKSQKSIKSRSSSSEAHKKRKLNEDNASVSTSTTTNTTTNARRRKKRSTGSLPQKSTTMNMADDSGFKF